MATMSMNNTSNKSDQSNNDDSKPAMIMQQHDPNDDPFADLSKAFDANPLVSPAVFGTGAVPASADGGGFTKGGQADEDVRRMGNNKLRYFSD
jgi:hypothetical protein